MRLTPPNNETLIVDTDEIVFTSLKADVELDLIIHDGLTGDFGGKEVRDEDGTGAVTVANINDTDADQKGQPEKDSADDEVRALNANGRDEVDLMKLIAKKPKPYLGGAVTIAVTQGAGRVKLWKTSLKQELVDGFDPVTGIVTFPSWVGGDKTMWIEITEASQQVADVEITMTHGTATPDSVKATAVWGTVTRSLFDPPKDWVDVPDDPWKNEMDENLQKKVRDDYGGTGKRPIKIKDGRAWAQNVMLMEFTITPADVTDVIDRVIFDITRQRKHRSWFTTPSNPTPQPGDTHPPGADPKIDWPDAWEAGNDDSHDEDESSELNSNGHMYVIDAPGTAPVHPMDLANQWWVEDAFFEFLRVSFGKAPEGNDVRGGICSPHYWWHSFTTVKWSDFNMKWERVGTNEILGTFVDIDDDPPQ